MKSLFNGRVAYVTLLTLLSTIGSGAVIAADVCLKKPELPKCSDPPPDPDPENPTAENYPHE
jgi:hypothetical protein